MNNTVSVDIAGYTYQIRTDEEPEYVRELANMVTVKILEIKRDSGASVIDCAIMAALDFADCFLKEQQKKKPARKKAAPEPDPEIPTII